MSDIKLFRYCSTTATELSGRAALVEKQVQSLVDNRLDVFLGVRFLASEYSTGKSHRGRIDTLGLDENGCPVIIEYKRFSNENVINQGLFYLDWLLDHQAEFQLLVANRLGPEAAGDIDWSGSRVLCIAADFTRYDQHAVAQINRSIELVRYRLFDPDLLMLELVNSPNANEIESVQGVEVAGSVSNKIAYKTRIDQFLAASPELRALWEQVRAAILALGDDVQHKLLKHYDVFRRLRNFICVVMWAKQDPKLLYLKLDATTVPLEENFSRDVTQIGHWGTGDLELTLRSADDLKKALPLLERCYQEH